MGYMGMSDQGHTVENAQGPDLLHRADQQVEELHVDRDQYI